MSSPHQVRKTEEKLGLIFGRIRSIWRRLNSLAWQRGAFGTLAWISRDRRDPRARRILSAAADVPYRRDHRSALVALAGITNSVRAAWRMHVNRGARRLDRRSSRRSEGTPGNHHRARTTPEGRQAQARPRASVALVLSDRGHPQPPGGICARAYRGAARLARDLWLRRRDGSGGRDPSSDRAPARQADSASGQSG